MTEPTKPEPTSAGAEVDDDQAPADGGGERSTPDEAPAGTPARSGGGRGMLVAVVAAVALLVVALVTFILVGQRAEEAENAPAPASTVPADEFVEYTDQQFGFEISYPQGWDRVELAPGNRRLVVQESGINGMSVSVLSRSGVADLRTFARDTIGQASPDVEVLFEREVVVNNLRGFYFVYAFRLDGTSTPALHAHYFLERGEEIITLVFQAESQAHLERLASAFDQIVASLRAVPATAGTTATTTTTVP